MTGPGADAFTVLGLPRDADLSDAQVRLAYRERLRAVHPDIGGDGECAAAVLERIEDLASARDLAPGRHLARELARAAPERAGAPARAGAPREAARPRERRARGGLGALLARVRYGRWWLLAARVVAAVVVPAAAWLAAPGYWAALAVGSVTWLLLTGRYDLAPGPSR